MLIRWTPACMVVAALTACNGYNSHTSRPSAASSATYTYPGEYNQLREVGWEFAAK